MMARLPRRSAVIVAALFALAATILALQVWIDATSY